jgi:RNA polymerase sigma-70 factor (ECF subfamily)
MTGTDKNRKEATDMELINGYLSGDNLDFEVLYDRYKNRLYSYLNNMLPGQHALVDDLFQQTWLKAINSLRHYRCRNRFQAWLLRIAHNLAIDHFRKNSRQPEALVIDSDDGISLPDFSAMPWQALDRDELSVAIGAAIKKLNPLLREVFLLRRDGESFKEIAKIQKCSVNTALGRMQYALKNLQKLLLEWRNTPHGKF